jgi:hypothetical protein
MKRRFASPGLCTLTLLVASVLGVGIFCQAFGQSSSGDIRPRYEHGGGGGLAGGGSNPCVGPCRSPTLPGPCNDMNDVCPVAGMT